MIQIKKELEVMVRDITHFDGEDFGYCPSCEKFVTPRNIYCNHCGQKLKWK